MGNAQSSCRGFTSFINQKRLSICEYSSYPWDPMDWEIKEWHTELRENDIIMHEYNLKRINEIRKEQEEREEKERKHREREIEERENELRIKQMELEKKELELKEKAALLEIAIRVNELSIATRFGGLEKRFEELEIASRRRRSFDLESIQRSNDQMNSAGDDERSTESEQSNQS